MLAASLLCQVGHPMAARRSGPVNTSSEGTRAADASAPGMSSPTALARSDRDRRPNPLVRVSRRLARAPRTRRPARWAAPPRMRRSAGRRRPAAGPGPSDRGVRVRLSARGIVVQWPGVRPARPSRAGLSQVSHQSAVRSCRCAQGQSLGRARSCDVAPGIPGQKEPGWPGRARRAGAACWGSPRSGRRGS
jgi:hypothetical protein